MLFRSGFVSEWLLLQAFLLTPGLPNSYLNMLVPVAAASLALTFALSGYVMVKFYGVVFLGKPREEKLKEAHDAGAFERIGLMWLAAGCVLLGILPVTVILQLGTVTRQLVGAAISDSVTESGWLFITPIAAERASYSPLVFLLVLAVMVPLVMLIVRSVYHGRLRRSDAWDCGFPAQTSRMQDTAEGFGQPIKRMFEMFFRIERHEPTPFDREPYYKSRTEDRWWYWFYLPVARTAERLSAWIGILQRGRIHVYSVDFIFVLTVWCLLDEIQRIVFVRLRAGIVACAERPS